MGSSPKDEEKQHSKMIHFFPCFEKGRKAWEEEIGANIRFKSYP
jgi:hypothetical protein